MAHSGVHGRAIVLLLLLASCGWNEKGDDKVPILASALASAIRASDEAAFLRAHVQPNDMSPSGAFWLATKAGGVRPDDAWDRAVRDAFAALQRDLKAMGVDPATLDLAGVDGGEVYLAYDDKDRQNLQNLKVRMKSGSDELVFSFAEGMLSQRGWVLTGDPAVNVERASRAKQ